MNTQDLATLIADTRGGTTENLHLGVIAHVNAQGQLQTQAGAAQWPVFTRSALKPFQALPFVSGGGLTHFGFGTRQTALLCASHNGETEHAELAGDMLRKAGLSHTVLQCGCQVPLLYSYGGQLQAPGASFDERHHNCSGKHAGMVAHCVQHGLPLDTYLAPSHPLQQDIARAVARVCGVAPGELKMGIDGCSAPNYAMPLQALATGFARIAASCAGQDTTSDAPALAQLGNAMVLHPHLVSGTGRNDLAFMQAGRGDWVTKVGADAVQVVASKSRREAFAIKLIGANLTALHATTVAVLDQLGWLDDAQRQALAPWRASTIANVRGQAVGERKPVFKLIGA